MKLENVNLKVAQNGRMILPLEVRKALDVNGEGVVVLSMDGDQVRLSSIRKSLAEAREIYRTHAKLDADSDAFLAARRAETERDL
jgi:bifunctional DNA-binding transcriptional regulator/antitoxin component of YhaV-PrlF toxin-antitoxin module